MTSGPVVECLEDLIGATPLVRLSGLEDPAGAQLWAKLETANPGGSVKDRTAAAMLAAAEAEGRIAPGGTIVEATSGNTGAALAMLAARRGYRCVFVMPDKMSAEKVALLRALGAEVVLCPTAVAPDDPRSYYSVTARLAAEIDGAFRPDQYHNPHNPAAHERGTGPELLDQATRIGARLVAVVAGIGTGGTITGIGRAVRAAGAAVRVVGADPVGSVYSGGDGRPYLVEGIGEDFWPGTYDPGVVDEVIAVRDADAFAAARELARREGILAGGSAGAALVAARRVAARHGPDAAVALIVPDSGRAYLTKFHDDAWMAAHGFVLRNEPATVATVLAAKDPALPTLVRVAPDATVADAVAQLRAHGVSQLAVGTLDAPAPVGSVRGLVDERSLLEHLAAGGRGADPVEPLARTPVTVAAATPLADAARRLTEVGAALVLDAGQVVGIVTRVDLLDAVTV